MQKFLTQRQVTLTGYQRCRAVYTLAHSLFSDENDKRIALKMAQDLLSSGQSWRRQAQQSEQTLHRGGKQQHGQYAMEKAAHNVTMRLRDKDQKFCRDLGQCWQDFVDDYDQIVEDYHLNEKQHLSYLHNLLPKEGHPYYLEEVNLDVETYAEAVALTEKEFILLVRQTRLKNHLSNLRFAKFVNTDVNTAAALAIIYKQIFHVSQQEPHPHRGDARKIEFFRAAVIGSEWDNEPLSHVATSHLSYQKQYAELEIAVQLDEKSRAAAARDKITERLAASNKEEDIKVINSAR